MAHGSKLILPSAETLAGVGGRIVIDPGTTIIPTTTNTTVMLVTR
jgi:hypothetical protein